MYAPRLLIQILTSTTKYYSSDDIYVSGTLYKRALLNEPSLSNALSDIYYGVEATRSISVELNNLDGAFTTLHTSEDLRGKGVKFYSYDEQAGGSPTFEMYGVITGVALGDVASLTVSVNDPDPLQKLLPQKVLENSDFSSDRPTAAYIPSVDLGKPYNIVLGKAKKVPLRYLYALPGVLELYTTHGTSGSCRTSWNIWSGSYTIQTGDYLEFDVYIDGSNPASDDGILLRGSGWSTRTDTILDVSANATEQWYSQKISLASYVSNVVTQARLENNSDTSGSYRTFFKNIRITDGAGTTRLSIYNATSAPNIFSVGVIIDATNYGCNQGGFYDYLIGYGTIASNESNKSTSCKVYRGDVPVSDSEYKIYDGSQTSPYTGYAFIRFYKEQRDFSDNLYPISADLWGLEMGGTNHERNPVNIIKNFLSNSTYGLGLTVNTTSFTNAASVTLGNVNGGGTYTMADLKIDGVIESQTKAQDIFDELLYICRGSLKLNASGEYEITIDTYQSTSAATFGDNDGYYENIIEGSLRRYYTSTKEGIKSFTLKYKLNLWDNTYLFKNERTGIFSFGEDVEKELRFVGKHETADYITSYVKQRAIEADEKVEFLAGMEAKDLQEGDVITLIVPRASFNINAKYRIIEIEKRVHEFYIKAEKHTQEIYTYYAGTIPSTDETDTSLPTPADIVNVSGQGKIRTWYFTWDKSPEDFVSMYHVQIGDSTFSTIYLDTYVSANHISFTDDSLAPSTTVYCRVKAVTTQGGESTNWSEPGSTSATTLQTADVASSAITTTTINTSAVTYAKRQLVETQSQSVSLAAGAAATYSFVHNFGRAVSSGGWGFSTNAACENLLGNIVYSDNNEIRVRLKNIGSSTINDTITASYW